MEIKSNDMDKVKTEVRLALLERSNNILVWVAGALLMVVIPLTSFIMASSNKEVELETKVRTLEKTVIELTEALNLTNDDLGAVQTWADEQFVNKEVFEATLKKK